MAGRAVTVHYHDEQISGSEFAIADIILKQCIKAAARKQARVVPVHYHEERIAEVGREPASYGVSTREITQPAFAHYHEERIVALDRGELELAGEQRETAAAPTIAHYHEERVATAEAGSVSDVRGETVVEHGASPFDYHEVRIVEMDPARDATASAWFGRSVREGMEDYAMSLARDVLSRGTHVETKRDEREWGLWQKSSRQRRGLELIHNTSV